MSIASCPGCCGLFPEIEGPVHAYLSVSPGCWARFEQAIALHHSDFRYWPAHRLLTNAYTLQHGQGKDRLSIRSIHVHLAALYSQVYLDHAEWRVITLRRVLSKFDFKPLPQRWPVPSASIASVNISKPHLHLSTVQAYARNVLKDWEPYHGLAERLCRV